MAENASGKITLVLADLWPQYGLTISTPRLELHLPGEEELAALAQLAGKGVHRADERPFLTPWTDGSPQDRARFVLQEHWGQLGRWTVAAWQLGLGVFREGARGGEAVVSDRLRLTREKWTQAQLPPVRVDGMAACRPMFGL